MISLLIPTRGRRKGFLQTIESAKATASRPQDLEFIAYVDSDDARTYDGIEGIRFRVGPRIVLSNTWNRCAEIAAGEIFFQGNDDIVFRTQGWDDMVLHEFEKFPDKIVMVHGSDGSTGRPSATGGFGPHPFVHRKWFETLGYVTPPCFSSDYGDTWLNDLANALKRRRHVTMVIEHLHFYFGKAHIDRTTQDRLSRHSRDHVEQLYKDLELLRKIDIEKLGAAMR